MRLYGRSPPIAPIAAKTLRFGGEHAYVPSMGCSSVPLTMQVIDKDDGG